MVKIGLQLQANLENVTNVSPLEEDFRWYLKTRCLNCGEETEKWQYVSLLEKFPIKGGRGEASLVSKCKLCCRENSLDILSDSIGSYNIDDNLNFKTIIAFDCRGMEPIDFEPRSGWGAEGVESGTKFNEVNLVEKEWADYDEKGKESVGIYELKHQFVKL